MFGKFREDELEFERFIKKMKIRKKYILKLYL